MKKETISMNAVELMVSIDFKNRCATDKMIVKQDIQDVLIKRKSLRMLEGAAGLLDDHCEMQKGLGIEHIWVETALGVVETYVLEEARRLNKELKRAEERLATIDKQIEEFEQKDKKRKRKSAKKT